AFGREHEDGGRHFFASKLPADIVAAFPGQHHVQHDERGPMPADSVNGVVAAIAHGDFKAVALEHLLESQQNVRVIFDDQNFCFHLLDRSIRVYSCAFLFETGGAGSRRTKQLPPPGRGSQTMSPPWARAICRARVRPRPEPWMPLLNESWAR